MLSTVDIELNRQMDHVRIYGERVIVLVGMQC